MEDQAATLPLPGGGSLTHESHYINRASTLAAGIEVDRVLADEVGGQAHDVGVVVSSAELGVDEVAAVGGADLQLEGRRPRCGLRLFS